MGIDHSWSLVRLTICTGFWSCRSVLAFFFFGFSTLSPHFLSTTSAIFPHSSASWPWRPSGLNGDQMRLVDGSSAPSTLAFGRPDPGKVECVWCVFPPFSQKHLRCLGSRLVTLAAGERD